MLRIPQEVYQQIRENRLKENRQNERAAERGITREELLALRADKRANRQERRLAKKAAREEYRLNERAAKQGITVDDLLEKRAQRRQKKQERRQTKLDEYRNLIGRLEERRAANRGITREELLASRGENRKKRLERRKERSLRRKERSLNRSQMSPEAFEAFKQARLTERAAQKGITPDQLLANRAKRRANSDAFAALLREEGVRLRRRGKNRNDAHPLAAVTPNETKSIERKIKGYLGERPVYEDEQINFTGTGWEIL